MPHIEDWVRGFNAVVGSVVLVLLIARVLLVWSHYSYAQKMIFSAQTLYVLANTYGAIELIYQDAPWSWRILIVMVANILMFIYLAEPERMYRRRLGQDSLRLKKEDK